MSAGSASCGICRALTSANGVGNLCRCRSRTLRRSPDAVHGGVAGCGWRAPTCTPRHQGHLPSQLQAGRGPSRWGWGSLWWGWRPSQGVDMMRRGRVCGTVRGDWHGVGLSWLEQEEGIAKRGLLPPSHTTSQLPPNPLRPPVAKGGLPPWLLQRTPASPGGRGPRAALPPAVTLAQLVSEVLSLSPGSLEARPLAPGVRMEPRFESMDAYVQARGGGGRVHAKEAPVF